jgi:hypothetical protein
MGTSQGLQRVSMPGRVLLAENSYSKCMITMRQLVWTAEFPPAAAAAAACRWLLVQTSCL